MITSIVTSCVIPRLLFSFLDDLHIFIFLLDVFRRSPFTGNWLNIPAILYNKLQLLTLPLNQFSR